MVISENLELKILPATEHDDQLSDFRCGLAEMDSFIQSKLDLCNQIHFVNTFFVYNKKEIIALFSLSTGSIILEQDDFEDIQLGARDRMEPLEFTDNDDFLNNYFYIHQTYPSVELQYLAVREDYREKGIGKTIIQAITEKCKRLQLGCMFISVDAYDTDEYSAVPFYEKCGFGVVDVLRKNDIRRMIKTIWTLSSKE